MPQVSEISWIFFCAKFSLLLLIIFLSLNFLSTFKSSKKLYYSLFSLTSFH